MSATSRVSPKGADSLGEHHALYRLFQNAVWIVLEEIQDLYVRGGFYVDGIAGTPAGSRLHFLPTPRTRGWHGVAHRGAGR